MLSHETFCEIKQMLSDIWRTKCSYTIASFMMLAAIDLVAKRHDMQNNS